LGNALYRCACAALVSAKAAEPVEWLVILRSFDEARAFLTRGSTRVDVFGECYQAFAQVVQTLRQDEKVGELCAVSRLEREALECVHQAATLAAAGELSPPKAEALAKDLRRRLEGPYERKEYVVLVPGLALRGVLRVGNLELAPLSTTQDVDELCRRLAEQQEGFTPRDEQRERLGLPRRRKRGLGGARAALTPPPRNVSVASMHLALDTTRALEVAEESVQDALDLLEFFGREAPRAPGKVASEVWGGLTGSGDAPRWVRELRSGGCRIVFPRQRPNVCVTDAALKKMQADGFGWACGAVAKPARRRSALETKVLLAIKWIAEAMRDRSEASSLVKDVLAMETLLLVRVDQPLAGTLSERLAFLLGATKGERVAVEKLAKRVYDARSRWIHEGADTNVHDVSLWSWELAVGAVIAVIGGAQQWGWRTVDDVAAWVADQKYGVVSGPPAAAHLSTKIFLQLSLAADWEGG
jgi:hypothetical protein